MSFQLAKFSEDIIREIVAQLTTWKTFRQWLGESTLSGTDALTPKEEGSWRHGEVPTQDILAFILGIQICLIFAFFFPRKEGPVNEKVWEEVTLDQSRKAIPLGPQSREHITFRLISFRYLTNSSNQPFPLKINVDSQGTVWYILLYTSTLDSICVRLSIDWWLLRMWRRLIVMSSKLQPFGGLVTKVLNCGCGHGCGCCDVNFFCVCNLKLSPLQPVAVWGNLLRPWCEYVAVNLRE